MFARKPLAESPRVVKQLPSGSSPFRRGNIWDKNDAVRIYFSFFGPPCYGRTILVNPLFAGLYSLKFLESTMNLFSFSLLIFGIHVNINLKKNTMPNVWYDND